MLYNIVVNVFNVFNISLLFHVISTNDGGRGMTLSRYKNYKARGVFKKRVESGGEEN